MLTREQLQAATFRKNYLLGSQLFEYGQVTGCRAVQDRGGLLITGQVTALTGKCYDTTLRLAADGSMSAACSCPASDTYDELCSHAVALGLEHIACCEEQDAPALDEETRQVTATALELLLKQLEPETAAPKEAGPPVRLSCEFTLAQNGLQVQCLMGRHDLKPISNIPRMIGSIQTGVLDSFGGVQEASYSFMSFDAESRSLLHVLEACVMKRCPHYRSDEIRRSVDEAYSSLLLQGADAERMLELHAGSAIRLNGRMTPITEGDPAITFELTGVQGGALLRAPAVQVLSGAEHDYVLYENKLRRVSQEFRQRVLPLWRLFDAGSAAGSHGLMLSELDFSAFCRNLLPLLDGLADMNCTNVDLSRYTPFAPMFEAQLFKVNDQTIAAIANVTYGPHRYDLFAHEGHNGWHDSREQEVRECILRYLPSELVGSADFEGFDAVAWAAEAETASDAPTYVKLDHQVAMQTGGVEDVVKLLTNGLQEMSTLCTVYVDDAIRRMHVRETPKINVGLSLNGNLLQLNIRTDDMPLSEINAILASYRAKRKFHQLSSGDFIRMDETFAESMERIKQDLMLTDEQLVSGQAELPGYRALFVEDVLERAKALMTDRSAEYKQLIGSLEHLDQQDIAPPKGLNASLRPYQLTGLRWLCGLYAMHMGGVLADDMGLGKTLQVIAMLLHQAERDDGFSALVVAPSSLLFNWEKEVRRFAPGLRVQIIAGTPAERQTKIAHMGDFHISITSYDLLRRDQVQYRAHTIACLVIDEAQNIKNAATQAAQCIHELRAGCRFALTGTPIENRLSDLWSIFNCVMPGYLYEYETFHRVFEHPILVGRSEEATRRLKRMTAPFLLRRKKTDVLQDLPEKVEQDVYVPMTAEQRRLYEVSAKKLLYILAHSGLKRSAQNKIQILAALTRLRLLCCSPELCLEDYHGGSGKLEACLELLEEAVDEGRRVLVFSQFTSMLKLVMDRWPGKYLYLCGSTPKQDRERMVEEFQQGDVPAFFISLKAGGTGLNLTKADLVIHLDPWWNVAVQNQATDRAYRIGQQKDVTVLRLIASDTIEERIIGLQAKKAALAEAVVEGDYASSALSLDQDELMDLLRLRNDEEPSGENS